MGCGQCGCSFISDGGGGEGEATALVCVGDDVRSRRGRRITSACAAETRTGPRRMSMVPRGTATQTSHHSSVRLKPLPRPNGGGRDGPESDWAKGEKRPHCAGQVSISERLRRESGGFFFLVLPRPLKFEVGAGKKRDCGAWRVRLSGAVRDLETQWRCAYSGPKSKCGKYHVGDEPTTPSVRTFHISLGKRQRFPTIQAPSRPGRGCAGRANLASVMRVIMGVPRFVFFFPFLLLTGLTRLTDESVAFCGKRMIGVWRCSPCGENRGAASVIGQFATRGNQPPVANNVIRRRDGGGPGSGAVPLRKTKKKRHRARYVARHPSTRPLGPVPRSGTEVGLSNGAARLCASEGMYLIIREVAEVALSL
jgi:hypothetical protein